MVGVSVDDRIKVRVAARIWIRVEVTARGG